MTEKRFKGFYIENKGWGISDTITNTDWLIETRGDLEEFLKVLNKQYETIQQLKIKIEDIKLELENTKEHNDTAHYELYQVKNENEQLKSEYKVLHTQYQDLMKFVENNFNDYLTREKLNKQIIKLSDENEELKQEMGDLGTAHAEEITKIEDEFDEEILKLEKENEQLKQRNKRLEYKIQRERNSFTKTHERWSKEAEDKIKELSEENEQLKQRNDRQAKRLAELYELMAKKDWESLTEIIDDFCSCEEQLQREWRTYE